MPSARPSDAPAHGRGTVELEVLYVANASCPAAQEKQSLFLDSSPHQLHALVGQRLQRLICPGESRVPSARLLCEHSRSRESYIHGDADTSRIVHKLAANDQINPATAAARINNGEAMCRVVSHFDNNT